MHNADLFYERLQIAWEEAGYKNRADFTNRNGYGITKQDISHWKRNPTAISVKKLIAISESCNCSIDFLLGAI